MLVVAAMAASAVVLNCIMYGPIDGRTDTLIEKMYLSSAAVRAYWWAAESR